MAIWQVWAEGYRATGDEAPADLMGSVDAPDFQTACDRVMATPARQAYYDPARRTYWGCRLFDNEREARRSYG